MRVTLPPQTHGAPMNLLLQEILTGGDLKFANEVIEFGSGDENLEATTEFRIRERFRDLVFFG